MSYKSHKNRNLAVYFTDSSSGMNNISEDFGNCEPFVGDKIAIPLAHNF